MHASIAESEQLRDQYCSSNPGVTVSLAARFVNRGRDANSDTGTGGSALPPQSDICSRQ
jgi:hypothetical protein